jgi:serine/threonine protein kinase/tetratricopeptide (TPR) repeat protein
MQSFRSLSSELAHRVEAFEVALAANPDADFAPFLPEAEHPLYLPLLGELIRIDLEHSWTGGRGKRVAQYVSHYPAVLAQPILLRAVAFEEYRQRRWAGQAARPTEYHASFGLDTSDWPEFPDGAERPAGSRSPRGELAQTNPMQTPPPTGRAALLRPEEWSTGRVSIRPIDRPALGSDSELLSGWQDAAELLPAPGATFLGFRLVEELGRGAFGRVYLARQGDLAGRPVALKVACDIADESQTLAQMQHTNIVPIYSFHRVGQFQAVCMPYFGRTTLAHVVRHISDRPTLPSSGKELRSTLNIANEATAVVSGSRDSAHPDSTAAAPVQQAPPDTATEPARADALDGWSRLEGLSYIEAILTLGSQLADGLGHAHRRGILHRDLKPANVLLTDDGRPMLLDFNLAEDVKQRHLAERASIGGTLPYMGPEHIEAYRTGTGRLDERCDLYSLGVILFELLTGRHPFPIYKGASPENVRAMVADRQKPPPLLRPHNPAVSPAVEAIVRKCIAPEPADRYQTADDLREDLDRHLSQLPLKHAANPSKREVVRKWLKRHPRLTSSSTVAAVAAVLFVAVVAGAVYARERTRGLEARGRLADHQTAFRDAQLFLDDRNRSWPRLDEGLGKLRGVLARYDVPEDPAATDAWLRSPALRYLPESERSRVKEDVGEAFHLMAQVAFLKAVAAGDGRERSRLGEQAARWNELAGRYGETRLPRAVREQRAVVAELRGNGAEVERFRREADAVPLDTARDCFLVGIQLAQRNRHRDALKHLERATRLDPENFSAWFVRGSSHLALEQYEFAAACYNACVSLRPDDAPAWTNRGLAFAGLRFRSHALKDFDRAIELAPKLTEAFIHRAEARRAEGDLAGAEADYTRALDTGNTPARVYFLRANVRHDRGNESGEKADREAGFRFRPADELSWIAWAENKMGDDPKAALGYVEEALKHNPMSVHGLQLKAHILAERLHRPDESLAVLNRAVELHPDHVPGIAGRGVVLARAGKCDDARRDAKTALRLDTRAPNLYQVACIYALTAKTNPEDKREALQLLWAGLRQGFGLDIVHTDTDLDPLRNDQEFKDLVKDAEALHGPRKVPGGQKK